MLTTAQLTAMRAAQTASFDRTGTIKRPGTYSSDGAGGGSAAADTTVATDVPYRLAPSETKDLERIEAQEIKGMTVWRLTFPYGTDVQLKDRFVDGSTAYEIAALWGPHSYDTALRALAVER